MRLSLAPSIHRPHTSFWIRKIHRAGDNPVDFPCIHQQPPLSAYVRSRLSAHLAPAMRGIRATPAHQARLYSWEIETGPVSLGAPPATSREKSRAIFQATASCRAKAVRIAPRDDGQIPCRCRPCGVDRRGAPAAPLTRRSSLPRPGRGRVTPAGRGPPQLLDRPAIPAGLNGDRRGPGPPWLNALGCGGGRAGGVAVARRMPASRGVRLGGRLPVSPGGGHADTARVEAGLAA